MFIAPIPWPFLAASDRTFPPEYRVPPVWSFLPFLAILLVIAVFPLIPALHHFWEKNRNKLLVALLLAAATILYYALLHPGVLNHGPAGSVHFIPRGWAAVEHVLRHAILSDYVPFIVLLFSLYTISGGIFLRGDLAAHPRTNTAFLGTGALLASFIGTTGASMLLIRPLLSTNRERRHVVHTVIFFIFLVSNIGGSLTPLGDPPLFLGYLRGVPFWWTLRLVYPWIFTVGILLILYYLLDSFAYRRETGRDIARDERQVAPLGLEGKINFLWLLGVVAAVALVDPSRPLPGTEWKPFPYLRELLLLALTAISWFFTPRNASIRQANEFNFGAIQEVACLFIGIFVCMQTPVEYLQARGPELGLKSPASFFWASGSLSSFLDNAPTYVVFFETAKSLAQSAGSSAAGDLALPEGAIALANLLAISLGSVFMGSMTYIGNGPNFMVKAIAESRGVKMPSFFAYMLWSIGFLLPTFFAMTLVFLR